MTAPAIPETGTVVVDASLAVKWIVREPGSNEALALLETWIRSGVVLSAPPLLLYEVSNVLHQLVRRGAIAHLDAMELMGALGTVPLNYETDPHATVVTALTLAHECGLSATYDAAYLALAESLGTVMWTADRRLADRAGVGERVRVLSYS